MYAERNWTRNNFKTATKPQSSRTPVVHLSTPSNPNLHTINNPAHPSTTPNQFCSITDARPSPFSPPNLSHSQTATPNNILLWSAPREITAPGDNRLEPQRPSSSRSNIHEMHTTRGIHPAATNGSRNRLESQIMRGCVDGREEAVFAEEIGFLKVWGCLSLLVAASQTRTGDEGLAGVKMALLGNLRYIESLCLKK